MSLSDSDSDDFFSDIRKFRQQLGLSQGSGHTQPSDTRTTTCKRAAPEGSADQKRKQQCTSAKPNEQGPRTSGTLGMVSACEIAAIISPRRSGQRQRKKNTIDAPHIHAIGSPSSSIPVRTPESRITSIPAVKPVQATPVATPRASGVVQPRVDTGSSDRGFSMRSLWESAEASPAGTPIRRIRPSLSETESSNISGPVAFDTGSGAGEAQSGLLGRVEDAIVTDEDLSAATRKLGQSQTLTQQQIIREIRSRVLAFAVPLSEPAELTETRATLLCQFHTLGHGTLSYSERGVEWRGDFLGPVANMAQSLSVEPCDTVQGTEDTELVFAWSRASNLRVKNIDGDEFIMATVDSDLGIAFQLDLSEQDAHGLVNRMNDYLRIVLADERAADSPIAISSSPSASSNVVDAMRCLLRVAAERGYNVDIEYVLEEPELMDRASELVLEFSEKLARKLDHPTRSEMAQRSQDSDCGPEVCSLCCGEDEEIELVPCKHRVCNSCFAQLRSMHMSGLEADKYGMSVECLCPWDRTAVTSWMNLAEPSDC
ncbi:hypothetical protein IW139_001944 [Coemansia sp. RSA 353]|nr:hypothetical protein IW144_001645 [Coemansia sp. RSA 522]KAJ2228031.1 hypothetical protein EV180_002181 [Coemansia sp. RSA 518]KAJ2276609.1 hypothetical protein J3F81_001306 [Coemansia sp. RSA 371]KAJ2299050.1 hypothetical protein IW139_001944 [Coemansia sp. RSA 353]KAJ2719728.1 hypothetical protein H4S00_003419 [Coemansia sp. D1744]